jgi:hypothetical protein
MDDNDKNESRTPRFTRKQTRSLLKSVKEKQAKRTKAEKGSTKPKLDLAFLESRVREELVRQLVRLFKSRRGSAGSSSEGESRQGLMAKRIRARTSQKRVDQKEEASHLGSFYPTLEIDEKLLEERVRATLMKLLNKGGDKEEDAKGSKGVSNIDKEVLEVRIREELSKHFRKMSKGKFAETPQPNELKVDLNLLEDRIRQVLKRCLDDLPTSSQLSDEDIDRIIRRATQR